MRKHRFLQSKNLHYPSHFSVLKLWPVYHIMVYYIFGAFIYFFSIVIDYMIVVREFCFAFITSPPEGVARYWFHHVCMCARLCVCVSGQYFGILFLEY